MSLKDFFSYGFGGKIIKLSMKFFCNMSQKIIDARNINIIWFELLKDVIVGI